jgi:hypothetical protein
MVFVEIGDPELRAGLARFLDASFGGSVYDHADGLELRLPVAGLAPRVKLVVVERLLRAWSAEADLDGEVDVVLTAQPSVPGEDLPARRSLRLP